ncbi:MAG: class II fructose-bisphosphate aldolase [Omnitrophica WOR_2 bacterium]
MALVKVEEIYQKARRGGYGVSGFCAENLDMILAILSAAEEAQAPVVVVLWEADIQSVGAGYLEAIVKYGAGKIKVPVAFMLDHGVDKAACLRSILDGHSCVMIDASHAALQENIRITREVCEIAHPVGVMVEGELGTVRRSFENTGPYAVETVFTDPEEVPCYTQQSGVDSVAISVGTESGIPLAPPHLDLERLSKIAGSTDAYLVIHGGSGISIEDLRAAIHCGATAFRFASEMRIVYLDALEKARKAYPPDFPDTRLLYEPARAAARELIVKRMQHLGCAGKAW